MARNVLTSNVDYYVSSTGSDTTGNGSATTPWASVTKAYAYAQQNLDLAGQWGVIVYLQNDITGAWTFDGPLVGARGPQSFIVRGTANDQSRTVYSPVNGGIFFIKNGAAIQITRMAVQPMGAGGNGWTVVDGTFDFGT